MKITITEKKPEGFNANVDVAAAYIEIDGEVLFLKLAENKEYANRWGVPAGKFEKGESPETALRRELFEETGISMQETDSLNSMGQLYVRKPNIDYVFHMFKVVLKNKPEIRLSDEHIDFTWVSFEEAKQLDLLDGAEFALKYYLANADSCCNLR